MNENKLFCITYGREFKLELHENYIGFKTNPNKGFTPTDHGVFIHMIDSIRDEFNLDGWKVAIYSAENLDVYDPIQSHGYYVYYNSRNNPKDELVYAMTNICDKAPHENAGMTSLITSIMEIDV